MASKRMKFEIKTSPVSRQKFTRQTSSITDSPSYRPTVDEGDDSSPIVPEDEYLAEPSEPKKKKKGNKGIMIAVAAGAAVLLLSKK